MAMAGELCVVTYGCLHHHHAAILIPSVISLLSLYRVCLKRALFNHVLSAAAAEKNKNKITRCSVCQVPLGLPHPPNMKSQL